MLDEGDSRGVALSEVLVQEADVRQGLELVCGLHIYFITRDSICPNLIRIQICWGLGFGSWDVV